MNLNQGKARFLYTDIYCYRHLFGDMYSLILFSIAIGIAVQKCQGLPFDKLSVNDVQRFEKELTIQNSTELFQKANSGVKKLDGSFKGKSRLKALAWSDCSE